MSRIKNKCVSCGVKFEDHLGLIGTCKKLKNAISTLKVISTWATFDNGSELIPEHVEKLCKKTLKEIYGAKD